MKQDIEGGASGGPANMGRRELLERAARLGAATVAGAVLPGCGATEAEASRRSSPGQALAAQAPYRIDVHCHHIPDFYRSSLAEHGIFTAGGVHIPAWSPELAVAFMGEYGIQTQVVSISEPGVYYLSDAAERLALAARINDYTARTLMNGGDPLTEGRFGGFAVLPLADIGDPADVSNAAAEARRALLQLGMDGVGLYSNYGGVYPGDPRLAPLFAALNELGAMVFLHPVTPSAAPDTPLSKITFLYEFPFDTTRAVVSLLYQGVFARYPRMRWLIAHAGGAIPFLAYRTSLLTLVPALAQNLGLAGIDDGSAAYSKLYYDTALSPAPSAMRSVRAVTDAGHVMFATDWPFSAPLFVVPGNPAPQLSESFDAQELLQVERGNALAQFPRLAAMEVTR